MITSPHILTWGLGLGLGLGHRNSFFRVFAQIKLFMTKENIFLGFKNKLFTIFSFDGFPKNLFHYLVRGAGGSRSGVQGGGGNHGTGRGSQRGTYLGRGMWMGKNLL